MYRPVGAEGELPRNVFLPEKRNFFSTRISLLLHALQRERERERESAIRAFFLLTGGQNVIDLIPDAAPYGRIPRGDEVSRVLSRRFDRS
jgi:hypothetical protein